ncbi:endospore germination permease [Paenibacillus qinlingensis]|uniref:Spore germination protein KB n=1 Tax=Paenibacillus qinlingensis TaxID=1837343 RepID=A0ABU1NRX1_9BACL|nr:endospore germination permease [Paenibacillus qinlingensis]MDR6550216.1 spore germination protein KB [Paenibacillus qinlingensis]
MENAQFTAWQMFLLTISFVLGTSFFIRPGGLISAAKEYAWIIPIAGGIYGVLIATLWLYLSKRHPGLSIVQICIEVLGRKVGLFFASLYILLFIQLAAWVVRNLGDFIKMNLLMRTPIEIVHLMFLLVSAYVVIKGAESIAMQNEFLTPILIIAFWIVFFLMLKGWDWANFGPAQVFQPITLIRNTKEMLGFPFSEAVCLVMFFPFVKKKLVSSFLLGIGAAAIILSLIVFCVLGIVGSYRSSHLMYPLFTLAQELPFSFFLDHMEVVIVFIWFLAISIKLSIAMYCSVLGISQLFGLKNRTFTSLSLIGIILPVSLLFDNVIENMNWDHHYSFAFDSIFAVVIPVLLIVVSWIRKDQFKRLHTV